MNGDIPLKTFQTQPLVQDTNAGLNVSFGNLGYGPLSFDSILNDSWMPFPDNPQAFDSSLNPTWILPHDDAHFLEVSPNNLSAPLSRHSLASDPSSWSSRDPHMLFPNILEQNERHRPVFSSANRSPATILYQDATCALHDVSLHAHLDIPVAAHQEMPVDHSSGGVRNPLPNMHISTPDSASQSKGETTRQDINSSLQAESPVAIQENHVTTAGQESTKRVPIEATRTYSCSQCGGIFMSLPQLS